MAEEEVTPQEVIAGTLQQWCNVEQTEEAEMVVDALYAEGFEIVKKVDA